MDPVAEMYYDWSPYNYTVNNPIRFIDPNGMWVGDPPAWLKGWNSAVKQFNDNFYSGLNFRLNNPSQLVNDATSTADATLQTMSDVTFISDATGNTNETAEAVGDMVNTITEIPNMSGEEIGALAAGATIAAGAALLTKKVPTKGLGNPFKGKSVRQVRKGMQKHVKSGKLELKYNDPVSGSSSYKNKQSGYSYNVDTGKSGKTGKKVENAHVDVNYPNPKPKNAPKKRKFEID